MPMSPPEREEFGEIKADIETLKGRTSPKLVACYLAIVLTATLGTVVPFGVYTIKSLAKMTTEVALLRMHVGLAMVDNKSEIKLCQPEPPPKPPAKAATVATMEFPR